VSLQNAPRGRFTSGIHPVAWGAGPAALRAFAPGQGFAPSKAQNGLAPAEVARRPPGLTSSAGSRFNPAVEARDGWIAALTAKLGAALP
jgi:hypothetical protein